MRVGSVICRFWVWLTCFSSLSPWLSLNCRIAFSSNHRGTGTTDFCTGTGDFLLWTLVISQRILGFPHIQRSSGRSLKRRRLDSHSNWRLKALPLSALPPNLNGFGSHASVKNLTCMLHCAKNPNNINGSSQHTWHDGSQMNHICHTFRPAP